MRNLPAFTQRLRADKQTQLSFSHIDFANASKAEIEDLALFVKETQDRHQVSWRSVDLSSLGFNKVRPLFKAMMENPSIRVVSLSKCGLEKLSNETLIALQEYISPNIRILDLSDNKIYSSMHAIQFLIQLENSKLQTLNCDRIGLEECDFPIFEKIVKACAAIQSLTSVSLEHFNLESDDLTKYCQLMSIILKSKIENISFRWGSFGEKLNLEEWAIIQKLITEACQLKSLNLSCCGLGFLDLGARIRAETGKCDAEAFVQMFGSFLQTTTLETIDISYNDFEKEATVKLLNYAIKNKKLNLIIKGNKLTDKEIEELSKLNQGNEKIKMDVPTASTAKTPGLILPAFSSSPAAVKLTDPKITPAPGYDHYTVKK